MATGAEPIFGVVAPRGWCYTRGWWSHQGHPQAAPPSPPLPPNPGRTQAMDSVKLEETLLFAFFSRTFPSHRSVVVPEVHGQVEKGQRQRRKRRRWLLDGFLLP